MPTGVYKRTKEYLRKLKKRGFQKGNTLGFKKGVYRGYGFKKGHIPITPFKKGQPKPKNAYVFPKGENNPAWKGGRKKDMRGYILILKHSHPFADKKGYILEHRFIVEKMLGHYLKQKEIVHHINKVKGDNRPENLMAFSRQYAHNKFAMVQEGMKEGEIIFDGRNFTHNE